MNFKTILSIASVIASLFATFSVAAQDVDLLVKHHSTAWGADGVTRSTEFSERMVRRGSAQAGDIWVQRVLPHGAHSHEAHAQGGKAHKHLDVATAARWITRSTDGSLRLRLVPEGEKLWVEVAKVDWPNVGFDGNWLAAWNLIDPAVLNTMRGPATLSATVPITYTSAKAGAKVTVRWSPKDGAPLAVESSTPTSQRKTTVQVLAKATQTPWQRTNGYTSKDYSDYLD